MVWYCGNIRIHHIFSRFEIGSQKNNYVSEGSKIVVILFAKTVLLPNKFEERFNVDAICKAKIKRLQTFP